MSKKRMFRLFLTIVFFACSLYSNAQTATLGSITANPGQDILVPLSFYGMTNLGAITLFIGFDESVMTFNGITNISPEGAGTFYNYIPNPSRVGLSWIAPGGSGVDFPNGKYLDLEFTFIGGQAGLVFEPNCEIADWDGNIIPINYLDGSVIAPSVSMSLKVMLQGAYQDGSGGYMDMSLLSSGILSQAQPFSPGLPYYGNVDPKWLYSGSENIAVIPTNVVDWVLVELRDASSLSEATSSTVIAQKPCLLLNDGSVVDTDGSTVPEFFVSFNQGAYVVIYHRNHLGIISSIAVTGFGNSYYYDFTTSSNQVAGGNNSSVEVESGIWAMLAGDINGDNIINDQDKNLGWDFDASNSGYLGADSNLDTEVDNRDKNDLILQNLNKISGIPD